MAARIFSDNDFFEVIESMRFPLVCLVVMAHLLPFSTPQVQLSFHGDDVYTLISEMISHNLARIAVRCYFLVSGFFFFKKLIKPLMPLYSQQIKKRIRTLLIPYVFWNLALLFAVFIKHSVFVFIGLGPDADFENIKSSSLYELFWGGPINFPLWYIRDLMCMMTIAPLFFILIRYLRHVFLFLMIALYLSCWETQLPGLSSTAVVFFGIGAYLAMFDFSFLDFTYKYRKIWVSLAIFLLLLATLSNGRPDHEFLFRVFVLFGVLATFGVFTTLMIKRADILEFFKRLAPTTFFIYVTHEIYVINALKGFWYRSTVGMNGWWKLLGYFTVPIFCIVICSLIYYLLKYIAPRTLSYISGERIERRTSKRNSES